MNSRKNIMNISMLTETPTRKEIWGYDLNGGGSESEDNTSENIAESKDVKKLSKLLADSDINDNEVDELSDLDMNSELKVKDSENTNSESSKLSDSSESSDSSHKLVSSSEAEIEDTDTPSNKNHSAYLSATSLTEDNNYSEQEYFSAMQHGGLKKINKKNRKHFFEDSDLSSTSSDSSSISSLDSDSD
jgi:hypothetical protein